MARLKTQVSGHDTERPAKVRRILLRALAVVLVLLCIFLLAFFWVVRSLPRIAIIEIGRLTNTRIAATSVKSNLDGSVLIDGLVVRPDRKQMYDDAILKAKAVYARFRLSSVLLLRPRLREIRINDFVLDAQFDLDTGCWNIGAFKINIPKRGSGKMPAVNLERGTLHYSKVLNGKVEVAVSVPVDARFALDEEAYEGYGFNIRTAKLSSGFGKSNLSGFWKPGRITVTGGVASTDIPSLERAWAIDVLAGDLSYKQDRTCSVKLRMKGLRSAHSTDADSFALVKPAFLEESTPFRALQQFFGRYHPAGVVDIDVEVSGNFDRLGDSKVTGKVNCKDLSIWDSKLPYKVEHLTGQVDFTQDSFTTNGLSGKHGDVNVALDGWSRDFGANRKYQCQITSNNMVLDDDLYNALKASQEQIWSAFSPRGIVAVDYRLSRASPTDKQETLTVGLRGTQAAYRNFPYPLQNLTGTLFFDRDSIVVSDVVSVAGDRRITLNGKVTARSTERPIYYISIKGNNIPLDRTLGSALPARHKKPYDQVDPNGLVDIDARVFTPDTNSAGTSFLADVSLKKTSLKVGKSPLVVSDISAETIITPESLSVKSFAGRYGQGTVYLTGGMQLADESQGQRYHWKIGGKAIPLSKELIGLWPETLKKVASEFQPQGTVDVNVDLNKAQGGGPSDYTMVVDLLGGSVNVERFIYPLKDITGRLGIGKDSVTLDHISAALVDNPQPEQVTPTLTVNGLIDLANGTFNSGVLEISATDVSLSEQLGAALPKRYAGYWRDLSPMGRFDLDLKSVKISNSGDDARLIDITGTARLKTCSFNLSGIRAELDGLLDTKGLYKTGAGFVDGRLSLAGDTLTIKGKAVTGLKADITYNPNLKSWAAENSTADCYGGRLIGNLQISKPPDGVPEYLLDVGFNRVDLQQFLLAGRPKEIAEKGGTTGMLNAALSLGGRISDGSSRRGVFRLRITNMQIGKVSPLAKLLSVLRLTEPTDYTFERMLVDSYVNGDKLLIKQFDMSGRSVAFSGSGWMDLPSENVNLTLNARGQRLAAAEPSVLQSLTEGLGGAVVRMEVTGNYHNPKVETKALPVIEDSLKILGAPAGK